MTCPVHVKVTFLLYVPIIPRPLQNYIVQFVQPKKPILLIGAPLLGSPLLDEAYHAVKTTPTNKYLAILLPLNILKKPNPLGVLYEVFLLGAKPNTLVKAINEE